MRSSSSSAVASRVVDRELDLDGQVRRELEEMLLVQDAVTAESGDRPKRRASVDPHRLRLLEQPFVQRDVPVHAVLVQVETQQRPGHDDVPQR